MESEGRAVDARRGRLSIAAGRHARRRRADHTACHAPGLCQKRLRSPGAPGLRRAGINAAQSSPAQPGCWPWLFPSAALRVLQIPFAQSMFLLTSSLPAPRKAAALRASDAAAAAGASTRRRLSQVLQRALWLFLALAAACAGGCRRTAASCDAPANRADGAAGAAR